MYQTAAAVPAPAARRSRMLIPRQKSCAQSRRLGAEASIAPPIMCDNMCLSALWPRHSLRHGFLRRARNRPRRNNRCPPYRPRRGLGEGALLAVRGVAAAAESGALLSSASAVWVATGSIPTLIFGISRKYQRQKLTIIVWAAKVFYSSPINVAEGMPRVTLFVV